MWNIWECFWVSALYENESSCDHCWSWTCSSLIQPIDRQNIQFKDDGNPFDIASDSQDKRIEGDELEIWSEFHSLMRNILVFCFQPSFPFGSHSWTCWLSNGFCKWPALCLEIMPFVPMHLYSSETGHVNEVKKAETSKKTYLHNISLYTSKCR